MFIRSVQTFQVLLVLTIFLSIFKVILITLCIIAICINRWWILWVLFINFVDCTPEFQTMRVKSDCTLLPSGLDLQDLLVLLVEQTRRPFDHGFIILVLVLLRLLHIETLLLATQLRPLYADGLHSIALTGMGLLEPQFLPEGPCIYLVGCLRFLWLSALVPSDLPV